MAGRRDKSAAAWGKQHFYVFCPFSSSSVGDVREIFDGSKYAAPPLTAILDHDGRVARWKARGFWEDNWARNEEEDKPFGLDVPIFL